MSAIAIAMRRAALAMLAAAGCADAGTTDSARCERACTRDGMCNMGTGSPYCEPDCAERLTALRTEFRVAYLDCYGDLSCNDDPPESCEVTASQEVDQRPIDDNFLDQCQPVNSDCEASFDSAFCFLTRYYEQDAVEAAMACLAMPCPAIEACLRLELPLAPFG